MKSTLSSQHMHHIMTYGISNPFDILGMHESDRGGLFIRVCYPQALDVLVVSEDEKTEIGRMQRIHDYGLFQLDLPEEKNFFRYKLRVLFGDGSSYTTYDVYR